MASRRSHAPTNNQQIEYELWGSWYKVTYYSSAKRDLYQETHCKLRSSAAVGTCVTSI